MAKVYDLPEKDIRRSRFELKHRNLMTMSSGLLYPIYLSETLPGDTFSVDVSSLARMATPIHPVMDDCFMDIYFFHVPARLTWDHWSEFMGQRPDDPYQNQSEYTVPQLISGSSNGIPFKSLMDYFGMPAGQNVSSFSALPFRAYSLIWNEWFRSEFLQNPINIDTSDADHVFSSSVDNSQGSDDFITSAQYGGSLAPVNKFHDLFTSATLQPQNGADVPIPLNGIAPVYASANFQLSEIAGQLPPRSTTMQLYSIAAGTVGTQVASNSAIVSNSTSGNDPVRNGAAPINLVADLGANPGASLASGMSYSTINDLRFSFAVQSLLENDLFGKRYTELIKAHFGVNAPSGLLQRPEFLGHKRISINMSQVLQTSATDNTSPQGNASGFSMTKDFSSYFTKSFVEHGYVIGLACIRTTKSYSQGLDKMFTRKDRFDYYFPELANLPNQPIKNSEIYSYGDMQGGQPSQYNDEVFGYAEAWYEYRTVLNKFCGEFRSNYPQSLDSWHYGEDYQDEVYLSDEWLREDRSVIDRTLAVDSDVSDQFICDFYFINKAARPLPVYSVPGLRGFF